MLIWPLMFILVALSVGLLVIAFTAAGARRILTGPYPHTRRDLATYIPPWLRRLRVGALEGAFRIRRTRLGRLRWRRGVLYSAMSTTFITAALVGAGVQHVYFDRTNLPDIERFARFEFPAIGTVYDVNGQPFIELTRERRRLIKYENIPWIVRDAIIAAEDKNFFSHSGFNYSGIPRVLAKVRMRALAARLVGLGWQDNVLFPQGGSTITQQLVRGYFLKSLTAQENSSQLRHGGLLSRALSTVIGARSVNMLVRKLE